MNKKWRGVTFVEMTIVVTIIGLLSIIAYPKYKQSVARNKRVEAWGIMVELSQFMEKNYLKIGCYTDNSCAVNVAYPTLPFDQVPRTGTAYYTIAITAPVSPYGNGTKTWGYQLTATPKGVMAGDACANLVILQPANGPALLSYATGTANKNTHTASNGEWCF